MLLISTKNKPWVVITFAILGCLMYVANKERPGDMLVASTITLASVQEKKEKPDAGS